MAVRCLIDDKALRNGYGLWVMAVWVLITAEVVV